MENKQNKTSKAKLESNKRYQAKHKKEVYRNQKKSRAKNFILNDARIDELEFFSELINNRQYSAMMMYAVTYMMLLYSVMRVYVQMYVGQ